MIEAWRLSGAGNDFLALVEPPVRPTTETIRAWCRRGVSLGADGLFVLSPGDPIRMTYWNADGSDAALCLNGSRCAAQLAFHLGWAEGSLALATGAGLLGATRVDETRVELEVPMRPERLRKVEVDVGDRALKAWGARVGVPHLVVPWEGDLATCPVADLGPRLRAHPVTGGEGANVHFVAWPEPGVLEIRSFERGVEAETLACGTGVLAAAAVGVHRGDLRLPAIARVRGGFDLLVSGRAEGREIREWRLAGDARILARCEILSPAENVPDPRWTTL